VTYLLSTLGAVLIVTVLVLILGVAYAHLLRLIEGSEDRHLRVVHDAEDTVFGPRACLFCGRVGHHQEWCSRLDRLDRGMSA
jgi:hypothetical protein